MTEDRKRLPADGVGDGTPQHSRRADGRGVGDEVVLCLRVIVIT